jgi:phage shock protein E
MKTTKTTVLALALSIAAAACANQQQQEAPAAKSPEQKAWDLIRDGALLIDVRTQPEFDAGHLEGALRIGHEQIDDLGSAIGADKDRAVVLYCRSGRRSGLAQKALQQRGFTNVVNGGGYEALLRTQP